MRSFFLTLFWPIALAALCALVATANASSGPGRNATSIAAASSSSRSAANSTSHGKSTKTSASCALSSSLLAPASSPFWLQSINHQGISAFNTNGSSYKVFRNVKDYGAKGDGVTDDTAAINSAITDGSRCGQGCDSSTLTPALVYFPSGKYLVSSPIVQLYYTQLVGDARNPPTIAASASFSGIALIDADPYIPGGSGAQYYTNQNNFYRQIRNFVIDTTAIPASSSGTGIHWQVAQATSLTNIVFNLNAANGTAHQGIFMENGSGGFLSDLVFNGGKYGMWVGNQQFTVRNVTINNADTGVFQNWNWGWTYVGLQINSAKTVAFDVAIPTNGNDNTTQDTGSVVLVDSSISNSPIGVRFSTANTQGSGFSILLDNLALNNVSIAVGTVNNGTTLQGGTTTLNSYIDGHVYTDNSGQVKFETAELQAPSKPSSLMKGGSFFTRAKPQYAEYGASAFISARSEGAKGDGKTDDTAALNAAFAKAACNSILFIDAGTYLVTDTIKVPVGTRVVGEVWSTILATGSNFADQTKPRAVVQVGQPGDSGVVEISDLLFSTQGPTSGAVLVEWNVAQTSQGSAGMWDSHVRIGGAEGTNLRDSNCLAGSALSTVLCTAAALNLHLTPGSSAYLENNWIWTADHDLDSTLHNQTTIYNGRGVLVESQGPTWMYGTASEHNQLFQYSLSNAKNVLLAMIQTETPYYQGVPPATQPFTANASWNDPTFSNCASTDTACAKAWGFRAVNSSDILLYGAGLYSFFENYQQTCIPGATCQQAIFDLESSSAYVYGLATVGTTDMVVANGKSVASQADNKAGFASTIGAYLGSVGGSSSKRHVVVVDEEALRRHLHDQRHGFRMEKKRIL